MLKSLFSRVILFGVPTFLLGCSSPTAEFGDDEYYEAVYGIAAKDEVRNPVVVIHGILGAQLNDVETGQIAWGAFTGQSIDPNTPEGARLIGLPLRPPTTAFEYMPMDERVQASGPVGAIDIDLGFDVLSVGVYADILNSLGIGGYADSVVQPPGPEYASDHFTCSTFFYDWRRDNVSNAIQLDHFLKQEKENVIRSAREKIETLRAAGGDENLFEAQRLSDWLDRGFKFDVVAHSMGGLVARYYLRYGAQDLPEDGSLPELNWAGAEMIDRMILVGTPSFGSVFAMLRLQEGFDPAPIVPTYRPGLLAAMPALYQLLPRPRHQVVVDEDGQPVDLDFLDPQVWIDNDWGLLADDQQRYVDWLQPDIEDPDERRQKAEEWVTWCLNRTRHFYRSLDVEESTPCPVQRSIFVGIGEPTLRRFIVSRDDEGRLQTIFDDDSLYGPGGDMTVPRYSALADERASGTTGHERFRGPVHWDRFYFLPTDHIGLTSDPLFTEHVLFTLIEEPVRGEG